MLLLPMVLFTSALSPLAVFREPVVLLKSVNAPLAVFQLPVVLLVSAPTPVAVFSPPVVLNKSGIIYLTQVLHVLIWSRDS